MKIVDEKTGQEFDVQQIKISTLNEGDLLILSCDFALTREAHKNIKESFDEYFPGINALILEEGMKLEALKLNEEIDKAIESWYEDEGKRFISEEIKKMNANFKL